MLLIAGRFLKLKKDSKLTDEKKTLYVTVKLLGNCITEIPTAMPYTQIGKRVTTTIPA